jgi:hypothetical protein
MSETVNKPAYCYVKIIEDFLIGKKKWGLFGGDSEGLEYYSTRNLHPF